MSERLTPIAYQSKHNKVWQKLANLKMEDETFRSFLSDCIQLAGLYEDIGTVEELAANKEMLVSYISICRGKTPEEIGELLQAEEEARILPDCKKCDYQLNSCFCYPCLACIGRGGYTDCKVFNRNKNTIEIGNYFKLVKQEDS